MYRGDYFDHDPVSGLVEYYEETSDGKVHIHTYQDVEPIMDYCRRLRNEGLPDGAWEENGCSVYAILPMVIVGRLLEQGINVFDQNDIARVVDEINTNYSNFKTTYKHHAIK